MYGRIWRSIASVVVLVFLLGGTAITVYVDHSITAQIEDAQRAFLAGVDSVVSNQISSAQQMIDMLLTNPFIVQSIYSDNTGWNSSVYQSGQTVVNAVSSNQVYNSIYVIGGDRIAIKSSRRYQTREDEEKLLSFMRLDFRRKLIPWSSAVGGRETHNLLLLSALDAVSTPNVTGGVMINLDLDRIAEMAFVGRGSSEVYLALDGTIVASSVAGAFFTGVGENRLLSRAIESETELCDGYYVFSHTNPAYGYTLYAIQRRSELMTPVKTGLLCLLAVICAFLILALLVSQRFALHAYTPVKTILIQLEEQLPAGAGSDGLSDLQRASRSIRHASEVVSAYRHDAEAVRLGRFIHSNAAADPRAAEMLERELGYDGRQTLHMLLFQAQDVADARSVADVLQGYLEGYARFLTLDMPERRLLSLLCVERPAQEDERLVTDSVEQVLRVLHGQGAGKIVAAHLCAISGPSALPEAYAQLAERLRSAKFCAASALLRVPKPGEIPEELIRRAQNAAQSPDGEEYPEAVASCLALCSAMPLREAYHQLAMLCVRIGETGYARGAIVSDRLDSYHTYFGALYALKDYDALLAYMVGLRRTVQERIRARGESAGNPLAMRIVSYMEEHFDDPMLSAKQVADALGVSVSHLSRVMSRSVGCGFPELLQKTRLEHAACMLLERPDLPIAQLGQQCGFSSASYFTSSFKRVYGVTPSVYRTRHSDGAQP